MIVYWIMFLIPAVFAIHPIVVNQKLRVISFWLVGLIFLILIGLRHDVGGDWWRYIELFSFHKGIDLDFKKFNSSDYGYETLHWFSLNYFYGIYGTNLIVAFFFIAGLLRFCRAMPMPWLSLAISVQFLVIVVSMGYTRQSAAIGFFMWGLVDLMNGKKTHFYMFTILGALFHSTVLGMLPFGLLYNKKLDFKTIATILIMVVTVVYLLLLGTQIASKYYYYITIRFHHSDGAVIRVFMSFIASIIYLMYRKRFDQYYGSSTLWFYFSVASIIILPVAFYYSTFADRIAIYFIPIQLVVFSRFPALLKCKLDRTIFVASILVVYFFAMLIWLNFGNFSGYWLPYQSILTM